MRIFFCGKLAITPTKERRLTLRIDLDVRKGYLATAFRHLPEVCRTAFVLMNSFVLQICCVQTVRIIQKLAQFTTQVSRQLALGIFIESRSPYPVRLLLRVGFDFALAQVFRIGCNFLRTANAAPI